MTINTIVDRVRSICRDTFRLVEAPTWVNFDKVPAQTMEYGVFRIPPPSSQRVEPMFGFAEGRTDSMQVWVARKHNSDYVAVREQLSTDMHSLTAAIVRDAHDVSGDYAVLAEGRGHVITPDKQDATYVTLRLTLPVTYETQL
jgi:hypothetical protein